MRNTENYDFELADDDDFYDINVMNRNFEKLDTLLKQITTNSSNNTQEET